MPSPSEALGRIIDDFAKAKKDSLDLSIAAKESFLAQDLQSRASTRLSEQFEQSAEGAFNADDQVAWYDSEVQRLTANITNEDQRVQFKQLLNRSRGNYAINASKLEMQSLQEQEVRSNQKRHDSFMLNIANAQDGNTIDTLLVENLTQVQHYKQTGSRTTRKALDTYEDQEILAAVGRKVDLLKSSFALHEISRDEYLTGIEGIESNLLQNGMLDVLDGDTRSTAIGKIRALKQTALEGAQALELLTLENDYSGEVKRIEAGFGPNLEYANKLFAASGREPENLGLQNKAFEYQSMVEASEFYEDRRSGNLQSMIAFKDRLKSEVESGKLSGKKLELKGAILEKVTKAAIVSRQEMIDNSAEFFKNNVSVKQAALAIAQDPSNPRNYDLYVKSMLELNRSQGGRDEDVEFLTNEALSSIVRQVTDNTDYLSVEAVYEQILNSYSTPVGSGTAGEMILDQIAKAGGISTLSARYVGTRSFKPIQQAMSMDDKDLKGLWPRGDTDKKAILKEVLERIPAYASAEIARLPDDPSAFAEFQQKALKLAMFYPLDPSFKGSRDFGDAAEFALKHLINDHVEIINKNGMELQLPKKDPEMEAAKTRMSVFSTKDIVDMTIMNIAKMSGGKVQLRGDFEPMVNMGGAGIQKIPGIDYENMISTAKIVTNNRGDGFKVLINTEGGDLPLFLPDGKGGFVEAGKSWGDFNRMIEINRVAPGSGVVLTSVGELKFK